MTTQHWITQHTTQHNRYNEHSFAFLDMRIKGNEDEDDDDRFSEVANLQSILEIRQKKIKQMKWIGPSIKQNGKKRDIIPGNLPKKTQAKQTNRKTSKLLKKQQQKLQKDKSKTNTYTFKRCLDERDEAFRVQMEERGVPHRRLRVCVERHK